MKLVAVNEEPSEVGPANLGTHGMEVTMARGRKHRRK